MRTHQILRDRGRVAAVAALALFGGILIATPATAQVCLGDCNESGDVTVDEVVTMVNLALGGGTAGCAAGDGNSDGSITVDEIITAVNHALTGCPPPTEDGVCGNGVVESGEACDDGGICIGGDNAGTACTAEGDCVGNGICVGGTNSGASCSSADTCGGGECQRCRPFGGDGCAANCTNERTIEYNLVPGVTDPFGSDIESGTSGVVVVSILELGLPLSGKIVAVVGDERNGQIPVTIPDDGIDTPAIAVLGLACACVSGASAKTCGGVVFEEDGSTLARDCTTDANACAGRAPCAFVHGQGNTASGVIGCDGLVGTDLDAVLEDGVLSFARSGSGGPGSTSMLTSIGIGLLLGPCTGSGPDYGPDGVFCTADDPANENSATGTGLVTTGEACGTALGDFPIGPFCRTGAPATCSQVNSGSLSGTCLVTALPFQDVPQLGDLVGAIELCAQ